MILGKLARGLLAFAALALFAGLGTSLGTSPASAKVKWVCTHFTPKTSGFWEVHHDPLGGSPQAADQW